MHSKSLLLGMLLTLGLTACSQTSPPGVPQASQVTPGVTTYPQVIAALGTPTSDVQQADGSRSLLYFEATGPTWAYVPLGLLVGGLASQTYTTKLYEFDSQGVLK